MIEIGCRPVLRLNLWPRRIPQLLEEHRATGQLSFQALAVPLEYRYSLYVGDFFYESPTERLV